MSLRNELEAYMEGIDIIDTHEHLQAFEVQRPQKADVLVEYGTAYMQSHIAVAGMGVKRYREEIESSSLSVLEKWDLMEPYWEKSRYTGFGQHLDATARVLYGIPQINRETIEDLNRCFLESFHQNHYEKVMKEVCHIETSLLDVPDQKVDTRYFKKVSRFDPYVCFQSYDQWVELEEAYGRGIRSLHDLENAFEEYIRESVKNGSAAFKLGVAIYRSLDFEKVCFEDAEKAFNRMIVPEGRIMSVPWVRPFCHTEPALENYMLHKGLAVLNELKMPLQIHTGMQAWTGNYLPYSNPELLIPLFAEYPDVRFDLFHIGYPYQRVMGALAKMHPNVYIDMVWAHVLSPKASVLSLEEWLETIPYHKIIGFGADSCFIDGVAGQRWMAIHNIAVALENKVKSGLFTEKKACELAKAVLYDNPIELYHI